jgi:cbb3-type cytochrome c oxidase subunit III
MTMISTALALAVAAGCGAKLEAVARTPRPAVTQAKAPPPLTPTGDAVLDEYLRIGQALAHDSTEGVDAAAGNLEATAKAHDADIAQAATALRGKSLADARTAFAALSRAVIGYRGRSPGARGKTVLFHCPMAKAAWLQASKEAANPYYGSEMSTCGTVVEAPTWADAEPAFARQCARCHGPSPDQGSPKKRKWVKEALEHLDMSTFPFKTHHADVLARIEEALSRGKDDKMTMPADAPGLGDDKDVELILAWVRGGGLGPDGGPAAYEAATSGGHHGH